MSVSDSSTNAVLCNYEAVAENVSADLYFRWDADKLYVGMVTADSDLKGDSETYKGDGIQFRINAGETVDEFLDVYVTLDATNAAAHAGYNDRVSDVDYNVVIADGKLNIMFAISFADLGVTPAAGQVFAFNFLRISGTSSNSYAGWLACGPFFSPNHDLNPGLTECNKLVLA